MRSMYASVKRKSVLLICQCEDVSSVVYRCEEYANGGMCMCVE